MLGHIPTAQTASIATSTKHLPCPLNTTLTLRCTLDSSHHHQKQTPLRRWHLGGRLLDEETAAELGIQFAGDEKREIVTLKCRESLDEAIFTCHYKEQSQSERRLALRAVLHISRSPDLGRATQHVIDHPTVAPSDGTSGRDEDCSVLGLSLSCCVSCCWWLVLLLVGLNAVTLLVAIGLALLSRQKRGGCGHWEEQRRLCVVVHNIAECPAKTVLKTRLYQDTQSVGRVLSCIHQRLGSHSISYVKRLGRYGVGRPHPRPLLVGMLREADVNTVLTSSKDITPYRLPWQLAKRPVACSGTVKSPSEARLAPNMEDSVVVINNGYMQPQNHTHSHIHHLETPPSHTHHYHNTV